MISSILFTADTLHRFKDEGRGQVYHRFDVDGGAKSVKLNECDEESLQYLTSLTKSYLKKHEDELERCAMLLGPRKST